MERPFARCLVLGVLVGITVPALSLTPQQEMEDAHNKTKGGVGAKTSRFVSNFPPVYFKGKLCAAQIQFEEGASYPSVDVSCEGGGPNGDETCVFNWYAPKKGETSTLEAVFFGKSENGTEGNWATVVQKSYHEQNHPTVKYSEVAAAIQNRVNNECGADHAKLFEITRTRARSLIPPFLTFDECTITEQESPKTQSSEIRCGRNAPSTSCYYTNSFSKSQGVYTHTGSVNYHSNKVQNGLVCNDLKCNLNYEAQVKFTDTQTFLAGTEAEARVWLAKNCKP